MGSTVIRLTGIVVALAACGDDAGNRKIMDAPAVIQDEGMIDGATNPVTVTVTNSGGPAADIEVYFQNADSTLVATAHTDANGVASQVMAAGGFVTVVNAYGVQPGLGGITTNDLDTWAGVKPGDHLVFDTSYASTSATVTIQLPLDTANGAASYTVFTTCSNGGTATIPAPSGTGVSTVAQQIFLGGCGGTADVMVVANDIDNQAVSSFYVPAQPINDGDTIDYTAKTYAAVAQRAYELDNNPSTDNSIVLDDRFVTSRGQVYFASSNAAGATATTTLALPALPTGALDVVHTDQQVNSTGRNTVAWGPSAADYTVDYGASLLGDFSVDPTFDTGTQTLGWTLGAGMAPVFSVSSISGQRAGASSWSWQIVGPSGTQVALPTLPSDVADFTLMATDTIFIDGVGIGYAPGGYDAFRPIAFQGPPAPTGATGIAAYNLWQPPATAPSLFEKMHVRPATPRRVITPHRVWAKR
ncbi:MAG: hypothetical protein ABI591_21135 [Kofleriaceae bacterium]